jgi:phosphonate transport system ATP-binding protein
MVGSQKVPKISRVAFARENPDTITCQEIPSDSEIIGSSENFAVAVHNISKTFGKNKALDGLSLAVKHGEMVALIGASGSGKSTLLQHLNDLVTSDPEPCFIKLLGRTVQFNGESNCKIREIRADIGFIFQQFNLVGRLSLLTNVLTGMLAGVPAYRSMVRWFTFAEKKRAMEALARVGMAEYATQRASTLSGGQQQRGAIARALVQGAKVILADEPIASLDPASSTHVMEILSKINQEDGVTVLVSLHQVDYAMKYCTRSIGLKKGKKVFDGRTDELSTSLLRDIYGSEFGDIEEGVDMISLIGDRHESRVKSIKKNTAKDGRNIGTSSWNTGEIAGT